MKERLKALLKAWTACSGREGRRILLLIPLLVLIALLFLWQGKPRFERSFTMYGDRVLDSSYRAKNSRARAAEYRTDSVRPFLFDPNTVDRDGLLRLGFSPKQADGIVHYRQAGAVFRTAADFARCRMVSDRKFRELSPYIAIRAGGNFSKPETGTDSVREGRIPAQDSLFLFDPNTIDRDGLLRLGFSPKQADGIPEPFSARPPTSRAAVWCRPTATENWNPISGLIRLSGAVKNFWRSAVRRIRFPARSS